MNETTSTSGNQLLAARKIAVDDYNMLYAITFALSEICTRGIALTGKASFKDIRAQLDESLKTADGAIGPLLDIVNKPRQPVRANELKAAVTTLEAGNAAVKMAIIAEGQRLTRHLPADMAQEKDTAETVVWWAKRSAPERASLTQGQNPTRDPQRAP